MATAGGTVLTPNPSTYGSTLNTGAMSAGLSEVTFRRGRGVALVGAKSIPEDMSGSGSSEEDL